MEFRRSLRFTCTVDRSRPDAAVRRRLRAEVGFGCPVDGCGSPYLTWHHFDPPWREGKTHNPEGMVALCLQHHKEADSGAFTTVQLRALKSHGFLIRDGCAPAGRFNWRREQLVVDAGGGLFVRCPVFLAMAGRPMVWLSGDEQGNQLLNLDLWDGNGNHVFAMRDNDWVVLDAEDAEAPPSARSLIIRDKAKGIRLSVQFRAASAADIEARLHERERRTAKQTRQHYKKELDRLTAQDAPDSFKEFFGEKLAEPASAIDSQAGAIMDAIRNGWTGREFVVCDFRASIVFPYKVRVTGTQIALPNNNTVSGAVAIDCGIAIALG